MARLFGTDGVRGIASKALTAQLAYKLGFAGALVLAKSHSSNTKPVILIGMDTRISCNMLEAALISGICSAGADVIQVGVIPTPGVAYLTRKYKCDAGVMISASHNSFEYNGIKFFSKDGFKLPDSVEDEIEEIINKFDEMDFDLPIGEKIGKTTYNSKASHNYIEHLKRRMSVDITDMKIVIDCANGASSAYASTLFSDLGADVTVLANSPDGININKDCGSTHMGNLCKKVVELGADMGFAFDGDADRFLAVDKFGNIVDGDVIMSIIANDMKAHGELKKNTLVVTVMSNLGVSIMAKETGLELAKTKVGDRYVLEEMLKCGYNLGGEQSGHVILLDHSTTGDGMLTALALLKALSRTKKSLDEAAKIVTILPQVLLPAYVKDQDKENAMNSELLKAKIAKFEAELGETGRILVRASGTEPQIRVMLEGQDIDQITDMAKKLVAVINSEYQA